MPEFTATWVEARYCSMTVEADSPEDAAKMFDDADLDEAGHAAKPFVLDDSFKILDENGNTVYEEE